MRAEISFPLSARATPVRIAGLYIIGTALWVVLSDWILHGLIRGAPPVFWMLETAKGLAYVAVTGALLGAVAYRLQRARALPAPESKREAAEISFPLSARSTAVRVAALYMIGSTLWIVLSDWILHGLVRGAPPVFWMLETAKGLVYVAVTGILLGAVTYRFQRRQESARLVTESKLRKLRESGLIGIFSYDQTGTVKQANDAFLKIIGYTKQELQDDRISLSRLIAAEYQAQNSMADQQIAARGFSPVYEEELQRKDGSRVPVIGGRALMGGDEDYGIGYVLDMSDLKNVESQKAHLQHQLLQSEKLNALGQLAGGIAHDFNNLLNVIIGYCTLAQTTADDPNLVRQNTDRAIRAATDATGLIRQLLAFGRKQALHSSALELNALIESHSQMLQRLVGEDVRISFTPGDPVWVMADAVQIEQVLMNLVINARDAMDKGGDVTISTASRSLNEPIADLPPGEYAVLKVSDTGKGMEPGILERIFEPFFTTKETDGGTGLGLSTSYGIVKQSNGDISVDSAPGRGTTFTILLPKVEKAAEYSAAEPQGLQRPAFSGTILLVEDSPDLRVLFANVLERAGFHILRAGSSLEAIRVAQQFPGRIDLIISDVAMPKVSGPDGVTQLLKKRPSAKVIFISGDAGSATVETKATMIEKPVTPEALVETVRHTLAA